MFACFFRRKTPIQAFPQPFIGGKSASKGKCKRVLTGSQTTSIYLLGPLLAKNPPVKGSHKGYAGFFDDISFFFWQVSATGLQKKGGISSPKTVKCLPYIHSYINSFTGYPLIPGSYRTTSSGSQRSSPILCRAFRNCTRDRWKCRPWAGIGRGLRCT